MKSNDNSRTHCKHKRTSTSVLSLACNNKNKVKFAVRTKYWYIWARCDNIIYSIKYNTIYTHKTQLSENRWAANIAIASAISTLQYKNTEVYSYLGRILSAVTYTLHCVFVLSAPHSVKLNLWVIQIEKNIFFSKEPKVSAAQNKKSLRWIRLFKLLNVLSVVRIK